MRDWDENNACLGDAVLVKSLQVKKQKNFSNYQF